MDIREIVSFWRGLRTSFICNLQEMHPVVLTYTNCLFIRHNTTTLKISFTLTVYNDFETEINKLVIRS
jgi:hypothetical protein